MSKVSETKSAKFGPAKVPDIYDGVNYTPEIFGESELRAAALAMLRPFTNSLFPGVKMSSGKTMEVSLPKNIEDGLSALVKALQDEHPGTSGGLTNHITYHTFAHAVDSTQLMFHFLVDYDPEFCSEQEKFILLLACLSHDIGHFGIGNHVLNNELKKSAFSVQYSRIVDRDRCQPQPMQFYHIEKTLKVIDQAGLFTLEGIDSGFLSLMKVWITDLILVTDSTNQEYYLNVIKGKAIFPSMSGFSEDIKRPTVNQLLIMKCCDQSNVYRPFVSSKNWTEYILLEQAMANLLTEGIKKDAIDPAKLTEDELITRSSMAYDLNTDELTTDANLSQRMKIYCTAWVFPQLIALRDVNHEFFVDLCQAMASSMSKSSFRDVSYIKEICPDLREDYCVHEEN